MCADLRYQIFLKLDNASFLNIKSVYINTMSAHVVYYLTK